MEPGGRQRCYVGVLTFGNDRLIKVNDTVAGQIVDVLVVPGLFGRIIDVLGNAVNGKGTLNSPSTAVSLKAPGAIILLACT
jgi:F0F1-type ATP synthase alpha subunit